MVLFAVFPSSRDVASASSGERGHAYDVVIVGRAAGCVAASDLAQHGGASIALIEARSSRAPPHLGI